jgi:hypothetical protein
MRRVPSRALGPPVAEPYGSDLARKLPRKLRNMRVCTGLIAVMRKARGSAARCGRRGGRLTLALVCGFALAAASAPFSASAESARAVARGAASTGLQKGQAGSSPATPSASIEECVTSSVQAERSATFSGEMTASPGTGRMSMRIELQERLPGEAVFHTVAAPGLGAWRSAAPGVKVYRYIKQVTDLGAPAVYRAAVRFRWLTTKGKLIRVLERRTPTCVQPVLLATATNAPV